MYAEPPKNFSADRKLCLKAFFLAFCVAAVFFLPFVIVDRGIFLFYGDYNVQQIPFYQLAHRAIRSGNFGFNFYTDLGANFIGSYSFYLLGSPFFWLTLPFPNEALPYLMAPLFCLKFATAAATSCAYIRRFVQNRNWALIGGLLYAFSGFGIYNIFFNHFHEVIAFFPLLLLSLEEFVEDGRRGFFAFSVFLCSLCNYFFFFGEVVFVLLYFFVRLASSNRFRLKLRDFLCLVLEAVLGLCLSGVLLIPSVIAVLGNDRVNELLSGWNLVTYGNTQRYFAILECLFFPPDIPARPNFFPDGNAKWASLGAYLPVVGMCGVITFMQTHKRHFIRRMLGISLVMALIPGLNALFFALNDAYYARWFFMPILLMATASVIAFERCTDRELNTGIRWSLGITAAFCAVGVLPTQKNKEWSFGLVPFPERFWIYVVIAFVCLLLCVLIVNRWRHREGFLPKMTAMVCITAVVIAFAFISSGKSHSYDEDFIIDRGIYGADNINLPTKIEDEFYRVDVYDGMDNLPMFWRLPTIQTFHSVVPESVMTFYRTLGIQRDVASRPEASYYALRTLTGCKYLFIEHDREERDVCYGFYKISTQNGFDIYQNDNYVPMGWVYETYSSTDYMQNLAETVRDRLMLHALVLTDEQIQKYGNLLEPISEEDLLMRDNLREDVARLRAGCAKDFTLTQTGFKSHITLKKQNLVFYSVPYDAGWSATVNGKPVTVERVNSGFVAVLAPAGENEIVFHYTTPGLYVGIYVSAAALLLLILYLVILGMIRRRHPLPKQDCSPIDREFSELFNPESTALPLSLRLVGTQKAPDSPGESSQPEVKDLTKPTDPSRTAVDSLEQTPPIPFRFDPEPAEQEASAAETAATDTTENATPFVDFSKENTGIPQAFEKNSPPDPEEKA